MLRAMGGVFHGGVQQIGRRAMVQWIGSRASCLCGQVPIVHVRHEVHKRIELLAAVGFITASIGVSDIFVRPIYQVDQVQRDDSQICRSHCIKTISYDSGIASIEVLG